MRSASIYLILTMVPLGFFGNPTEAADQVSHDASVHLMVGNGQGSAFEADIPHGLNDQTYRYRACHAPDGKIVAQAQYSSASYTAHGTWSVDSAGAICVKWSENGWVSACYFPVPTAGGQFAMTNETSHKVVATGKFLPPMSFDFCH